MADRKPTLAGSESADPLLQRFNRLREHGSTTTVRTLKTDSAPAAPAPAPLRQQPLPPPPPPPLASSVRVSSASTLPYEYEYQYDKPSQHLTDVRTPTTEPVTAPVYNSGINTQRLATTKSASMGDYRYSLPVRARSEHVPLPEAPPAPAGINPEVAHRFAMLPATPQALPSLPSLPPSNSLSSQQSKSQFSDPRQYNTRSSLSVPPPAPQDVSRLSPPPPPPSLPKQKTVKFPHATTVSPRQLADYLESVPQEILLLDLRTRDEFNAGHIRAPFIVNVDPIVLRGGNQSGTDLEDALVLSPRAEQDAFERRYEYELVIYYDDGGDGQVDDKVRRKRNEAIANLNYVIYEYADSDKPLKRQPCILIGGLKGWVDYCGANSLVGSNANLHPSLALHDSRRNGMIISTPVSTAAAAPQQPTTNKAYKSDYQTDWMALGHKAVTGPEHNVQELPRRQTLSEFAPASYAYNTSVARHTAIPGQPPYTMQSPQASMPIVSANSTPAPFINRSLTDVIKNPQMSDMMPTAPVIAADRESYNGRLSSHSMPTAASKLPELQQGVGTIANGRSTRNVLRRIPIDRKETMDAVTPLPQNGVMLRDDRQHAIGSNFSGLGEVSAGMTGLKNLGNTCYMNSVIQCLAATQVLAKFFLDGTYKKNINMNNKLGSRGVVAKTFGDLIYALYNDQSTFLSPKAMKDLIGKLQPSFAGNDQHDAQEFLTFILDSLHEDLNTNGGNQRAPPLTEKQEREQENYTARYASFVEWDRYLKADLSFMVNMFQGQYQSRLQCQVCSFKSTTYTPFSFLSLPLPAGKSVTLEQCFDLFVAPEVLDKDDAWFCAQCKMHRPATKKLRISRLPMVLIVHLKRFETHGRWSNKLDTFVDYPTENLDLTKYWPPYQPEDENWTQKYGVADQIAPFSYNLNSVVNHYGSLRGGHYTAYVHKQNKGWVVFDDSRVAMVSRDRVVSRDAYVLFYERNMTKMNVRGVAR
ncbi:uncharacterized protein V1518DRAFT_413038 [Limtongia smithiae]|uniref:uncharacterized protein n=1 Tax=Limtongia smithiae TaxID=1125753 RepID=UPI0034CF9F0E